MTCKKCKHEFCWVCMGPWSEHGTAWYSCNRYDEKGGVDARDSQSKSRASLERYLHVRLRLSVHHIALTARSTTTDGRTTSRVPSSR
jgi:ariadne-1